VINDVSRASVCDVQSSGDLFGQAEDSTADVINNILSQVGWLVGWLVVFTV